MGLFVPHPGSDFKWQLSSYGTTRPAAAFGTTVTPGTAPTMGAWAQLISGASMVNDAYGILININSASTSATTRNCLIDIGIDNAGGTNYVVSIPFLLGGHAAPYNVGSGGCWYYFPLFIPRGSSIAARATGNVTTAIRVFATVYGQPRRPDAVKVGSSVFSFGQTTSTATGTSITLGTTTKGNYVQVGAATTMRLWWWQAGYTCIDTTMTLATIHLDIAAGTSTTNNKLLVGDFFINTSASEQINNTPLTAGRTSNVASGSNIYVRGISSANADSATSVMAYGLGG